MSSSTVFRPATREDSRELAELVRFASGGVTEYVWDTLAPEYPGLTPVEIGAARYAREEGDLSYRNCTVAERDGKVIGALHAYPMEAEPEEADDEPVDPVLEPYAGLDVPGSYYVRAMAVFPEHRGEGLGTKMLEMTKGRARELACQEVSLLVFEQNDGAVKLYERNGFRVVDRATVVPHESHPLHGRRPANGRPGPDPDAAPNPGSAQKSGRQQNS